MQGRTYANIFGLVERFINAKVLELSRDHGLDDQVWPYIISGAQHPHFVKALTGLITAS